MNPNHPWFPYLATGVAVLLLGTSAWLVMDPSPAPHPGSPAPELQGVDLEGREVNLEDFRGRVVLLNVWATWCPPCVEEMPSMQRLQDALQDQPFDIVAVSIDQGADREAVRRHIRDFVDELGLTFTVLHGSPTEVRQRYQVAGIPETFLIDQDGVIQDRVLGAAEWDAPRYRERVEALLAREET